MMTRRLKRIDDIKENATSERKNEKKAEGYIKVAVGSFCGLINGLFGGGGGMVVVPLLEKYCSFDERSAHASAIAVILPISVFSGILNAAGFGINGEILIPVTLGSAVGGLIGALLLKNLGKKTVRTTFFAIMLAAGIKMVAA